MTTPDRTLGVAVCGTGWCAAQHIAAFLKQPAGTGHLALRPRRRARARDAVEGGRRARRRRLDQRLRGAARGAATSTSSRLRRRTTCMRTKPSARRAPASTSSSRSRPASTSAELVRIRDAVRRAGVRTIVSFELRYNPFLKFARWLRSGRMARRDPLRAHAVPVARHRLVQRMGVGAHARERAQPSARRRLPRRGCAALVLRPRADRP